MSFIVRQPTANQSPDPGQPGSGSVTTPTNTGHSSTSLSAGDGEAFSDSCLWTGFQPVGLQIVSAVLKLDWSQDGSLTGVGAKNNSFKVEYSTNGGGAWNTLFNHVAVTSPSSGTAQVSLTLPLDISQIRVRDTLSVNTTVVGTEAEITASVSNIKLEVTAVDGHVITIGL